MAQQSRNSGRKLLWLTLSMALILLAVFGGFTVANYIRTGEWRFGVSGSDNRSGTDGKNGVNNAKDVSGLDETGNVSGANGATGDRTVVLSKTPVELIYDVNPETGRVEEMFVGVLRTEEGRLDFIRIDTDVVYTMSSELYSALTPDNTTLPQMITFSELYRYYHNDKAFEAGRRIVSELLGFNIYYYSVLPDYAFEKLFFVKTDDEETEAGFNISSYEAKNGFGTDNSAKGLIEDIFDGIVTNWSVSERLRYLATLDLMDPDKVTFTNAPVYEKNESTALDTDATGSILYNILY